MPPARRGFVRRGGRAVGLLQHSRLRRVGFFRRRQLLYLGFELLESVSLCLVFNLGAAARGKVVLRLLRNGISPLASHLARIRQDCPLVQL